MRSCWRLGLLDCPIHFVELQLCQYVQIVARVSVSPTPVHIYAVDLTQEVWTHSDTDGTFDIFNLDEPSQLNKTRVPVSATQHTFVQKCCKCILCGINSQWSATGLYHLALCDFMHWFACIGLHRNEL